MEDNVIRSSKFVKILGIITIVVFGLLSTITFITDYYVEAKRSR